MNKPRRVSVEGQKILRKMEALTRVRAELDRREEALVNLGRRYEVPETQMSVALGLSPNVLNQRLRKKKKLAADRQREALTKPSVAGSTPASGTDEKEER